jgi:hypothetical protein
MSVLSAASADSPITWKSVPAGAATTVWAGDVAAADEIGGRYCEDCHVATVVDDAKDIGVMRYAQDPATAARLWTLSEQLVGETFNP